MKKLVGMISLLLACVTILAVPVSAVAIITGDSFGKTSNKPWEVDRYAPDEFDTSENELYITVGPKGFTTARPADKQDKYYAVQGKKLAAAQTSSNTWTATVKINVDDNWFSSSSNNRRAEFRVDLKDGSGNAISESPTLALQKMGSKAPYIVYYTSKSKTGWSQARTFVNGDKEIEYLEVEPGWNSLLIKCDKGVISYYLNEKKLGNCTLSTNQKDVYPSYLALGVYNYNRTDTVSFDNLYLYDGSYVMRQLSSEAQDERDERLESQYEKKRNSWEDKYTEYMFNRDSDEDVYLNGRKVLEGGKWYKQSTVKSKLKVSDKDFDVEYDPLMEKIDQLTTEDGGPVEYETRETKDMPDDYWDY